MVKLFIRRILVLPFCLFLGHLPVNLEPCLGKSCWLGPPDKLMKPCARNWSLCWKKTTFAAHCSIGIHLTVVDGKIVHAAAEFKPLAPPPLPVLPEWSPVSVFGGYGAPLDVHKAVRAGVPLP